jgi:hypothetical protein
VSEGGRREVDGLAAPGESKVIPPPRARFEVDYR